MQWPALTVVYGLKPWEADLLTTGEIGQYVEDLPKWLPPWMNVKE